MKKQDLLKYFDDNLLDKLFGFCYARTNDSHEAEELCSDIIYALVKAAHSDGEINSVYPFIWRVARNVYADFSNYRRKRAENIYEGDSEEILLGALEEDTSDDTAELLTSVYRRIAFLTKAYREVMIMFYIDGLSTAQIAKAQGTSEGAVRQRLFSARQKIKSEVEEMAETYNKPVALDKIDFVIWGTGNPGWGDPRSICTRMFSNHIVWLCHKKPMSASEIAEELNVPTVYVEEELEILRKGENGKYGFLRRLDNGKYALNFILLDKDVFEKANAIYTEQLPKICETISNYIEEHKAQYLAFPYLNKKVDMNLILWQQVYHIAHAFSFCVESALKKNHFADAAKTDRPFSVYGYVDNGKYYGGGWDGVDAQNVCGFSNVHLDNIYITRIKPHFHCGLNVSKDPQIQLALRAIDGLDVTLLSEEEKEHAAKAIECGYLYRDGDMLYTKILVNALSDRDRLFDISNALQNGYFDADAEIVAAKVAELIRKSLPDYLLGEWRLANNLASLPILDAVVECLIEKGVLTPPEDGIGAEGCWMSVEK
ncbi:MAG: sigma-70 family RNA polymerase sigma factor [Ruminococcaceae bacterium]|nr:sigma-70 family RNA polymerase sigma factor [Oscillospiraceae bacterium]